MFEKYIDSLKDEIIAETCNLINIPSVSEETNNPNMPFGKYANEALDYALNLGNKLGFRTKNIDGYCGYIEFGEGGTLLGIIGHLDVVPSGDGWNTPPFEATIKDNKIYGRGAIDDKGPVRLPGKRKRSLRPQQRLKPPTKIQLPLQRRWLKTKAAP